MSTADCPVCVAFYQTDKLPGTWIHFSSLETRLRACCILSDLVVETAINVKLVDFREDCLVGWMERLRDKRIALRDMKAFVESRGLVEGKRQLLFDTGIYYMEVSMFGDAVTSYLSTAVGATEKERQKAKAYLAALNRYKNPIAGYSATEN